MLATALVLALLVPPQDLDAPPAGDGLPGLVLRIEGARAGASVTTTAPRVGGTWDAGTSPHPSVGAEAFRLHWTGALEIPRSATYRFSAAVRGRFRLSLGGHVVLGDEAADAHAGAGIETVVLVSDPMPLEPGPLALEASFEKSAADARVQLLWESEDFARVPVPAAALRHARAEESDALRAERSHAAGRFAFENLRCGSCHARGDAAPPPAAPDLARIGARTNERWLFQWLESPSRFRPGTDMPDVFAPGASTARERADVARFLASLGAGERGPVKGKAHGGAHAPNATRGGDLFAQRGCIACHDAPGAALEGDPEIGREIVRLGPLGSKFELDALANFLFDPLPAHPAGAMPSFQLGHEEALDLAAFLVGPRDPAFEQPLPPLAAGRTREASVDEGRKLVAERGCLACHTIGSEPRVFPPAPALDGGLAAVDPIRGLGCVSATPVAAPAPRYGALLARDASQALAFAAQPARAAAAEAPAFEAARAIERFRCLQCHGRDGAEAPLRDRQLALMEGERASRLEQVGPPDLTGVGGKLRPEWLRALFVDRTRARPWLDARMPHFGAEEVSALATGFAALDGEELVSTAIAAREGADAEASVGLVGRDLIGKTGFACTACHDLAGAEAQVAFVDARGPDLVLTPERIRPEWFRAWLVDPQALVTDTKMPTFFPNGRSTLAGRHGLDTEGQIRALRDYLALGKKAPLPEGLRGSGGFSFVPATAPEWIRTPFDDAPRSITVGFPGGVSLQWDAERAILRRVWSGGFLRMDGTQWTGAHGPYPKPEGKTLWTATEDAFPWSFPMRSAGDGAPADPPAERALAGAPVSVRTLGLSTKGGTPGFVASASLGGESAVRIEERFVGAMAREGAAIGGVRLDRHVRLAGLPAEREAWLRLDGAAEEFHLLGAPAGSSVVRGEGGAWLRVPAAPTVRDLAFVVSRSFGGAALGDAPLPEPWSGAAATPDPLARAPLTKWFHEGEHPEGDHPFAREEEHWEIERLPIPEGIVLQGGGIGFLPDGSLAICTRRGEVWIVENATGAPAEFRWRRFARGLHEPLGLAVVGGTIHVLQKPELTRLHDSDGDGEADWYETVSSDWGLSTNFHEFAFGLEAMPDGSFFGTLGLAIKPGGATREKQEFARGGAFRIHPDGRFEVMALGLRTPNGTGIDARGRVYYTDNQGDYIPACKLQLVQQGEFYGQRFALPDREAKVEYVPATVWLPFGKVSHSASDVLLEDRGGRFGPFDGQLLVADFTNSHLLRVQLDTVKGREQGCVWILRGGFGSGLQRMAWGPDDRLYTVQTTGGWGAVGSSLFAFERVRYTGVEPFEMRTCKLVPGGFEITFTQPLDASLEVTTRAASLEQFRYHYWATYGSPQIDREAVPVTAIEVSSDRRTLVVKVEGLKRDRIVEIKLRGLRSAGGEELLHPECWYTVNELAE